MNKPTTGTFLGHPKGLFLLFGTEMWERFGYYGMRALLVLYLVATVENGGFGWTTGEALGLYGTFTMAVYLTPMIGGWLADNFIGQRKAIILGGILFSLGYFTLGIPKTMITGMEENVFYLGLILICCGNGLFKANVSSLVGELYEDGDHRRDGAFTIFYMGINLGAFLSPLIVGYLGEQVNWHYGFIAAGCGMLIGLFLQLTLANKYLGEIGVVPSAKKAGANSKEELKARALTKEEKDRTKVILIMSVFSVIFWAGFEQAGGLFNIYASQFTDRDFMGFEVPASWFQSLNAMFIILLAPVVASIWIKMDTKEPTSPVKFALAMVFLALGFFVMVWATMVQGGDTSVKVSMLFLVFAYLFHTLGELCLSPIGLSLVSKLAPVKFTSLLMGAWFFFTALSNKLAAFIGQFVGEGEQQVENAGTIFMSVGGAALVTAVIIFLSANKLVAWMHGAEGDNHHDMEEKLEEELSVTGTHEAMPESHN
ncbi:MULTISPECIES: peptide MFS transporter [Thalassomonas]|uniref:Peptide MFS transporter n=2 Tax=Thalassomonas TaxID=137583 RepID=A0AAE9YSR2_9GAMM|nr:MULTISPECIES: peptide MFS transporter [Thalassomonas]WDE00550.1 peptide MFS transporter [Thalassomonas actiniarum]WDE13299.1 peptide MFS transporter [Thalassomonas haliotis]